MATQSAVVLGESMAVEVIERRDTPGAWSVEAVDYEGDGEIYLAVFSGPESRMRAKEYARMKYDA